MDLATFRAQFPEFKPTTVPDALVNVFLAVATGELDSDVWGTDLDQGIAYRTAALLAASPNGQGMARVTSDPTVSTYSLRFDELRRIATLGMRVF